MLIFEFNGKQNGSYIDSVSGAIGQNTSGIWVRTEKGLAWKGNGVGSSGVDFGTIINLATDVSLMAWVKLPLVKNFQPILVKYKDSVNRGFGLLTSSSGTFRADFSELTKQNTNNGSVLYKPNQWYCIIATFNGTINTLYVDGVLDNSTSSSSITLNASDENLRIGNGDDWSLSSLNGNVRKAVIFDHILTAKERSQLYSEFLCAGPITRSIDVPLSYPKPTDLSNEVGIVAAYNMIPSGNTLVDISGNGNNGTITGAMSSKEGLVFDGSADNVTVGNIGNIKSIAFRIKLDSTTEKIMEGAANDKLIHASTGTLTYPEFDNAYVDGVDSNTVVAGQWHNVVIVSSTDVDFSACTLALNNTTYGNCEMEDLRFYNYAFTEAQAQDYNNSFARRVNQRIELSDQGVGATI